MANVVGPSRFCARLVAVALVAAAALVVVPVSAQAVPPVPKFGLAIDDYAAYDGASKCDPDPEPGVVAFQRLILGAYPGTGAGNISRACSGGEATSEHNEGRAWDWGVNVSVPSQKRAAEEVIDWLLAEDRFGSDDAMARRVGLMYMIWNRRIWFTGGGWSTYCVQRRGSCVDPDDGGARHPHTDHVHFSFSLAGARKATTFWNNTRSFITAIEPSPAGGYWLLGRNGGVYSYDGTNYYGGLSGRYPKRAYVAMASSRTGGGYWIANADGNVKNFGDAPRRADAGDKKVQIEDMAATPSGRGYWLLTRSGRVFPYGNATQRGDLRDSDLIAAGIAATPRGKGYWIVTRGGKIFAYGDARFFGHPEGEIPPVVGMAVTASGKGYWVSTETGRVLAYGDASFEGGAADIELTSAVTGIAANPSDNGYRIVTETGRVLRYGGQ